jgi:hypothetical protein
MVRHGSDFASLPRLARSEHQASSDRSANLEGLTMLIGRVGGLPRRIIGPFGSLAPPKWRLHTLLLAPELVTAV